MTEFRTRKKDKQRFPIKEGKTYKPSYENRLSKERDSITTVKLSQSTKHHWIDGYRYDRYKTVYSNKPDALRKAKELEKGNHAVVKKIVAESPRIEVWAVYYRTKESDYPKESKKKLIYHDREGYPMIHVDEKGNKYVSVRAKGGGTKRLYEGEKYRPSKKSKETKILRL